MYGRVGNENTNKCPFNLKWRTTFKKKEQPRQQIFKKKMLLIEVQIAKKS